MHLVAIATYDDASGAVMPSVIEAIQLFLHAAPPLFPQSTHILHLLLIEHSHKFKRFLDLSFFFPPP